MIKKIVCFFFLWISCQLVGQEIATDSIVKPKDTIVYVKNIDFEKKRVFKDSLQEKYNDKDFIYKENTPTPPKNNIDFSFLKTVGSFLQTIFPFLLGGFIVFLVLKIALGSQIGFFNFNKKGTKKPEKLVYEEEDIHEVDLEKLLQEAKNNNNYRLAIRYYYLIVLKTLSTHKLIDYHKDKTNTEYKFELEKGKVREQFSYLSYIYTYVWYGEFEVNPSDFSNIEKKYTSFKNSIQK